MIEENAQRRLADYLSQYATGVVSEWMRIVDVEEDTLSPGSGYMQLRARWAGDGTFTLDEAGCEEYGMYRLITRVESVDPAQIHEMQDKINAMHARVTVLHCAECTVDEDPRPWCDCVDDERCRPGDVCRKRAHHPSSCSTLAAEWIGSTFLHIVTGDRVRIGREEADVTRAMVQLWHARDGEWVPTGQKKADGTDKMMKQVIADDHWEVRAALRLATGQDLPLTLFPPETAVEILCTPARKAQLALSHAGLIGTTEI